MFWDWEDPPLYWEKFPSHPVLFSAPLITGVLTCGECDTCKNVSPFDMESLLICPLNSVILFITYFDVLGLLAFPQNEWMNGFVLGGSFEWMIFGVGHHEERGPGTPEPPKRCIPNTITLLFAPILGGEPSKMYHNCPFLLLSSGG